MRHIYALFFTKLSTGRGFSAAGLIPLLQPVPNILRTPEAALRIGRTTAF
jgi:hypothetical protein